MGYNYNFLPTAGLNKKTLAELWRAAAEGLRKNGDEEGYRRCRKTARAVEKRDGIVPRRRRRRG